MRCTPRAWAPGNRTETPRATRAGPTDTPVTPHTTYTPAPHWNKSMTYMEHTDLPVDDYRYHGVSYSDPHLCGKECDEDELPFGWERIDDPHYGKNIEKTGKCEKLNF